MKKTAFCLLLSLGGLLIGTPVFGQMIVTFGDSLTQGYPYRTSKGSGGTNGGYQPYLAGLLGGSYTVLNYGEGGEQTPRGVSRINQVIQAHPGSTMLIWEGVNDLGYGLSWNAALHNLGVMIDKCRNANITPIIGTLAPNGEVRNVTHNADIRKIARIRGVKVADIWAALSPRWGILSVDDVHPNRMGYKTIANVWKEAILAPAPSPQPPFFSTPRADNVQEVTASLTAKINPNGDMTTAYYQYGTTLEYEHQTPEVNLGNGFLSVTLNQDISPLRQNTSYHFRLVVKSGRGGEAVSGDNVFQTKIAKAPYAGTQPPTDVSAKKVELNGWVTPNNFQTYYYFQYGPTNQYGMETEHFDAGNGNDQLSVTVKVSGLTPETLYHYRIVAEGNTKVRTGQDVEFMTTEKKESSGCFIQTLLGK